MRRLAERGERVSLIVRDRSRLDTLGALSALGALAGQVEVHEHDGSAERLIEIVESVRPSIVYHLASMNQMEHQAGDLAALVQSNILFGTQLLEAMRAHNIQHLVNTGTYWQYASDGSYDPICLYAATKQAFDAILTFYARAYGLRCLTLVLFDTYGPHDSRRKLVPLLLGAAESAVALDLSPGQQRMALTYVDDVIDAYEHATVLLQAMPAGSCEAWDVRSVETITLRELVEAVSQQLGRALPVRWGARDYRPRERMIPSGTGRTLPGWTARTSLRDGLQRSVDE